MSLNDPQHGSRTEVQLGKRIAIASDHPALPKASVLASRPALFCTNPSRKILQRVEPAGPDLRAGRSKEVDSIREERANAEKQPTGRGPEGCHQNGPLARREEGAYLGRYVTDEQRSCRPIFIATKDMLISGTGHQHGRLCPDRIGFATRLYIR
jgi:hypothetical protein